jgi:hypothetical protein
MKTRTDARRPANAQLRALIDSLPGYVASDLVLEARSGGAIHLAERGLRNADGTTVDGTRSQGSDRRRADLGRPSAGLTRQLPDRRRGERRA